jgi:hypothetical protein
MMVAFLISQLLVVLFITLHDWVPLGRLNNLAGIRAADSRARLLVTTVLSDCARATRYQERFANTHAFLPPRHGIRPDTLHVAFHAVFVVAGGLLCILITSGRLSGF